mmetsp:Transcript_17424/g.70016  ORF Transcript_17424/g.70016 Transcript_17424/m.70016 type:complete len:286 (+) Transcript_17424:552-1409(+)
MEPRAPRARARGGHLRELDLGRRQEPRGVGPATSQALGHRLRGRHGRAQGARRLDAADDAGARRVAFEARRRRQDRRRLRVARPRGLRFGGRGARGLLQAQEARARGPRRCRQRAPRPAPLRRLAVPDARRQLRAQGARQGPRVRPQCHRRPQPRVVRRRPLDQEGQRRAPSARQGDPQDPLPGLRPADQARLAERALRRGLRPHARALSWWCWCELTCDLPEEPKTSLFWPLGSVPLAFVCLRRRTTTPKCRLLPTAPSLTTTMLLSFPRPPSMRHTPLTQPRW